MDAELRALFKYRHPEGEASTWGAPERICKAIRAVFLSCSAPGTLKIGLPAGLSAPLCGNPEFRRIAEALVSGAPGLVFFVLGGKSPASRELLLASLPNLQAASDGMGEIAVAYPADEAQKFLFAQTTAMMSAGVSEIAAIKEMTVLSRQCGMDASLWQ